MERLVNILHDMISEGREGRAVAEKLGKRYSTLMRELNPYDHSAKVGAETMLDIMLATGDIRPLEYMARRLGVKIIKSV